VATARSPGEPEETLKPSRAGMPVFGATVVTNARAYYHTTRGCGCNGHPAFPRPLLGERFMHNSDASRREIAELLSRRHCCDKREAFAQGSEATKQSTLSFLLAYGLLRFARNDHFLALLYKNILRGLHKRRIFSFPHDAFAPGHSYLQPATTNTEWGDGKTSIAARCVHARSAFIPALGAIPRMARCQFQFPAHQAADPETRSRKIRRLFMADHLAVLNMPVNALKRSHRHVVRAVHAVVGACRRTNISA